MIKVSGIRSTMQSVRKAVKAASDKKRDEVIDRTIKALKEATPIDTGEAREGWRREGDAIINDVPHVVFLNEGSSQQAPSHFIEATVLKQPDVKPNGVIVEIV